MAALRPFLWYVPASVHGVLDTHVYYDESPTIKASDKYRIWLHNWGNYGTFEATVVHSIALFFMLGLWLYLGYTHPLPCQE